MFKTLLAVLAIALAYVCLVLLLHAPAVPPQPPLALVLVAVILLAVSIVIVRQSTRRRLLASALACLGVASLSACSTAGAQQVLTNLQGCERHYNGVVAAGMTGGNFSGSVKIDCPTSKGEMTATPAATLAPAATTTPAP